MIKQVKDQLAHQLSTLYSKIEAENLAKRLMEEVSGMSYTHLILSDTKDNIFLAGTPSGQQLDEYMKRLIGGEPLQYILGYADFEELQVEVGPGVLIPRPETAYLCELVGQQMSHDRNGRIADLCTGSGCIALLLGHRYPNSHIDAVDIDDRAIMMTTKNRDRLGLTDRIFIYQQDILKEAHTSEMFDLIISNPPYVLDHERTEMQPHVLDHEPSLALFVSNDDPLLFYRSIIDHYIHHLHSDGCFAFEINQAMGDEMLALCKDRGLEGKLVKDLYGKNRYIFAHKH